ncbi:MAG: nucleoside triphosphate pyrophosphohydrolase [Candidatus Margulisbacteria bacterium]|nr:nucleoside triphosphate pyrophosphohydrolase [Candidatus Margulisiibacteriota bacterium]
MTAGKKFEEFIKIVRRLRKECPWDREQTFETLKPYLVEEVYEALQAIDDKDDKKLAEELGDMLLHVVMLSVFAEQAKKFKIDDVVDSISAKMVRRHPHVFGKAEAKDKYAVWKRWEKIKRDEGRGTGGRGKGMLDSIPQSLPALYRADKIQRRAARVGFDWDAVAGAWDKVHEELDEIHEIIKDSKVKIQNKGKIRLKEEIGDLLFSVVNVARKLEIDSEEALQAANTKFMRRFAQIEKKLSAAGGKLSLAQMDALWDKVKASER